METPPDPTTRVVIVAYGPPEGLGQALDEMAGAYDVVVVDNSSRTDVRDLVARAGAAYIDPGTNLGFAAAVNIALRTLDLDRSDVLLLNPDARIGPTDVERLEAALREESAVACVAPSHRAPASPRVTEPWWSWDTPAGAWAEAVGLHRLRSRRDYLSGATLLVRGTAFAQVGELDERFFLYCEDEDWQKRALRAGWKLKHCAEATAFHSPGGTETDLDRLILRLHCATERYVRKWYGAPGWNVFRSATIVGQLARWFVFGLSRRRPASRRSAERLLRIYLVGPERAALRKGAVPKPEARNLSAGPGGST